MPGRPLRAVIDTNVFVSGLISLTGSPGRVLQRFLDGEFLVLVSGRQREELDGVFARGRLFSRHNAPEAKRAWLLDRLDDVGLFAEDRYPLPIAVRDPKDEMLLAAALGGGADYLVSGDRDLTDLAGDPALGALRIVTPAEFLLALDAHNAG